MEKTTTRTGSNQKQGIREIRGKREKRSKGYATGHTAFSASVTVTDEQPFGYQKTHITGDCAPERTVFAHTQERATPTLGTSGALRQNSVEFSQSK